MNLGSKALIEFGVDADRCWVSSRSVADAFDAGLLRAMGAAIDGAAVLDAMSNHGTLAVRAPWRHRVDRTFEAVERHRLSSLGDAKSPVVVVTANVTNSHKILPAPIGNFLLSGRTSLARPCRLLRRLGSFAGRALRRCLPAKLSAFTRRGVIFLVPAP
jgi:hypothetical protein